MKRVCVLLPLVMLLLLPVCSQAADLQAGWYANISYPIAWHLEYMAWYPGWGHFYETPLGPHAPFLVSGSSEFVRNVSVPASVSADPEQSLVMPVFFEQYGGDLSSYIEFGWATNYMASQMYLQFRRQRLDGTDELLWEQVQDGPQSGVSTVAWDDVSYGAYYFKINVIPEPSGLASVALGLTSLLAWTKRRRHA